LTTRFILVRHGETDSSRERRFAGATDVPLSDTGLEQARALAKRLRAVRIDVMHVSPLVRCQQTAAPITEITGRKATVVDDIRECHFGDWENLTITEVLEKWPDDLQRWAGDDSIPPPGGECWADLGDRMSKWFDEASQRYKGRTVLAVTHGGPILSLARRLMGIPRQAMDAFLVETGSVSLIHENEGRRRIRLWNDITHLRDPLMETAPLPGYGPGRPPPRPS
jgi:ribonuclease H / adenosylcobalamin/alpha-ribazole phosphatase